MEWSRQHQSRTEIDSLFFSGSCCRSICNLVVPIWLSQNSCHDRQLMTCAHWLSTATTLPPSETIISSTDIALYLIQCHYCVINYSDLWPKERPDLFKWNIARVIKSLRNALTAVDSLDLPRSVPGVYCPLLECTYHAPLLEASLDEFTQVVMAVQRKEGKPLSLAKEIPLGDGILYLLFSNHRLREWAEYLLRKRAKHPIDDKNFSFSRTPPDWRSVEILFNCLQSQVRTRVAIQLPAPPGDPIFHQDYLPIIDKVISQVNIFAYLRLRITSLDLDAYSSVSTAPEITTNFSNLSQLLVIMIELPYLDPQTRPQSDAYDAAFDSLAKMFDSIIRQFLQFDTAQRLRFFASPDESGRAITYVTHMPSHTAALRDLLEPIPKPSVTTICRILSEDIEFLKPFVDSRPLLFQSWGSRVLQLWSQVAEDPMCWEIGCQLASVLMRGYTNSLVQTTKGADMENFFRATLHNIQLLLNISPSDIAQITCLTSLLRPLSHWLSIRESKIPGLLIVIVDTVESLLRRVADMDIRIDGHALGAIDKVLNRKNSLSNGMHIRLRKALGFHAPPQADLRVMFQRQIDAGVPAMNVESISQKPALQNQKPNLRVQKPSSETPNGFKSSGPSILNNIKHDLKSSGPSVLNNIKHDLKERSSKQSVILTPQDRLIRRAEPNTSSDEEADSLESLFAAKPPKPERKSRQIKFITNPNLPPLRKVEECALDPSSLFEDILSWDLKYLTTNAQSLPNQYSSVKQYQTSLYPLLLQETWVSLKDALENPKPINFTITDRQINGIFLELTIRTTEKMQISENEIFAISVRGSDLFLGRVFFIRHLPDLTLTLSCNPPAQLSRTLQIKTEIECKRLGRYTKK